MIRQCPTRGYPENPRKKHKTQGYLMTPVNNILPDITPLLSGCNRPLKMSFEDQLNILVYFSWKNTVQDVTSYRF